jgi:hypothetical protein
MTIVLLGKAAANGVLGEVGNRLLRLLRAKDARKFLPKC